MRQKSEQENTRKQAWVINCSFDRLNGRKGTLKKKEERFAMSCIEREHLAMSKTDCVLAAGIHKHERLHPGVFLNRCPASLRLCPLIWSVSLSSLPSALSAGMQKISWCNFLFLLKQTALSDLFYCLCVCVRVFIFMFFLTCGVQTRGHYGASS